jgi:hypothetical protein
MKYIILFFTIIFSGSLSAQDCDNQLLLQKPGTWKESSGGTLNVSTTELTKEKKVMTAINTMIKSKYSPKGVSAFMNVSYDRPELNMPCNSYRYSIHPLNFYCNGNTIQTASETSTLFEITVNGFDIDIYDTAQGDRALAEGFNVMPHVPIEKDGYWFFKETDASLGFQMSGKSCMWLITYDGKLPYSYVTKKEFLEKRKRSLYTLMENSAISLKDNLKNIELEKELTEKELKNDPEKLKRYIKLGYQYKKDKYQKFLADNEKPFKPAFENIEKQLQMSAEILNQKAIVKRDPNDTYNYLFTDENDPFGEVLIKPNSGYFNENLPKSSPQFFWIYMVWNHNEPIASMFKENSMKAVDFTALKNMLGK